jgi:Tfp pilus assembly protein PilP
MKRTLAISLLLGIAAVAVAQTPASTTPAKTVTVTQKPAPGTKVDASKVKVVAVPTAKPTVKPTVTASKPTVVAAKPSKPAVAAAKPAVVAAHPQSAKPVIVAKPMLPAAKPKAGAVVAATPVPHKNDAGKHPVIAVQPGPKNAKVAVVPLANKPAGKAPVNAKNSGKVPNAVKPAGTTVAVNDKPQDNEKKPEPRKTGAAGRRDPFVSPVVAMGVTGSGCSTGKRCLAIDAIALRGIVKSDTGMIAVVVNAMDKAYFLRENDPVFNGYVVKITGDSIVFKETFHDKLGKELTRDVTKSISRPAA